MFPGACPVYEEFIIVDNGTRCRCRYLTALRADGWKDKKAGMLFTSGQCLLSKVKNTIDIGNNKDADAERQQIALPRRPW